MQLLLVVLGAVMVGAHLQPIVFPPDALQFFGAGSAQLQPIVFPPGVYVGAGGAPPFKQYGGYIRLDSGKLIYAWLCEASVAPEKAPLVQFLNGGPGCSSLGDGLLSETGPYELFNNGLNVRLRDSAWNKGALANLLFFDTPVGVGLSYTPGAGPNATYSIDDHQTARDNAELLNKFYQLFPALLNNDLFITGESYAGTYIPTLVAELLRTSPRIASALKGFMIGNPCTDQVIDHNAFFDLVKSHAFIDPLLARSIEQLCPPTMRFIVNNTCCNFNFTGLPTQSTACVSALNQMYADFSNINLYNIYGTCDAPLNSSSPCLSAGLAPVFLNNDTIRRALHAAPVAVTGLWTECASLNYTSNYQSIATQVYPAIFAAKPSLRIWIYSGDTDACVPWSGTEKWTRKIGGAVRSQWSPWSVDGQVAGYNIAYERLSYWTVKGSGHEVPMYKPKEAFAMFRAYLGAK